jgi:hypothetical protein
MNRFSAPPVLLALILAASGGAASASPQTCSGADISIAGATCLGFFSGNLNGNSTSWSTVNSDLSPWSVPVSGAAAADHMLDNLSLNNATHTINFSQMLYGDTVVGIHYGNVGFANNVTAFYRFDAGQGIDQFTTTYASLSNATLYLTSSKAPPSQQTSISVPEPDTSAMILGGVGLLGLLVRRRKPE